MFATITKWLGLNKLLKLTQGERQNLTTMSMMGGAMAMTVAAGVMIWIVRYSWPDTILAQLAPTMLDGLFNVIYGMLFLIGIMVITQASIALGGKIKGKLGPAELEANNNADEVSDN